MADTGILRALWETLKTRRRSPAPPPTKDEVRDYFERKWAREEQRMQWRNGSDPAGDWRTHRERRDRDRNIRWRNGPGFGVS